MTVEEYAQAQLAITKAAVSNVLRLANLFRGPRLNQSAWIKLLNLLFPIVTDARTKSAELGREFYDSQRELFHPELPKHDVFLVEYKLEWFIEAMEPAKRVFLEPGASVEDLAQIGLRTAKEVENGGRKQIIRPVEDTNNPDPVVKGWARVATGRETCEFCLMLISRGPVYRSAKSAGLNADDQAAKDLIHNGSEADLKLLMSRWHAGCDCKVVPVFDKKSWPGRDAFKKAQAIWEKYSKMVDKDKDLKIPQNGNQRGPNDRKWSRSEATMAAIRRGFYNGNIDPKAYSIAA